MCVGCPPPAPPAVPSVIGWRAWYDDLSVFDSRETDWTALPSDGLQHIVLFQSDGRRQMMSSYDYYFRADGPDGVPIYAGNNDDPEETKRRYVNPEIKRGRWTTTERMHEINRLAVEARW